MKNRRKQPNCLNCGKDLAETDNYCPVCGQENTTFHLAIGTLLNEFISNCFNFDTKLGRSLKPFLFQPGELTNAFIRGERAKFVHPVRFYLIVSLIFFFLFSTWNKIDQIKMLNVGTDMPSEKELQELKKKGIIEPEVQLEEKLAIRDTSYFFGNEIIYTGEEMLRWLSDETMTPDRLLDSLQATRKSWFDKKLAQQGLKMYKDKAASLNEIFLENFPTMLFFFLPFVALMIKILYFRQKKLYIEHLIFTFHYHTFIFFLLSFALTTHLLMGFDWYGIAGVIILVYGFFGLKRVYQQSFFWTLTKQFALMLAYSVLLSFFILMEILISVLIF